MQKGIVIGYIILGALLVMIIALATVNRYTPGEFDSFATCLADKEAIFYGAFWCPYCQEQKSLFGKSEKLLPYLECSTPDKSAQTQECKDASIESYPTWKFTNGLVCSSVVEVEVLSKITGCELPISYEGSDVGEYAFINKENGGITTVGNADKEAVDEYERQRDETGNNPTVGVEHYYFYTANSKKSTLCLKNEE